jgi:hypothetical protein
VKNSVESYLEITAKIKVMVGIVLDIAAAKLGVVRFIPAKYRFWSKMILSIDKLNLKINKNVFN